MQPPRLYFVRYFSLNSYSAKSRYEAFFRYTPPLSKISKPKAIQQAEGLLGYGNFGGGLSGKKCKYIFWVKKRFFQKFAHCGFLRSKLAGLSFIWLLSQYKIKH